MDLLVLHQRGIDFKSPGGTITSLPLASFVGGLIDEALMAEISILVPRSCSPLKKGIYFPECEICVAHA